MEQSLDISPVPPTENPIPKPQWRDLVLYLVVGIGGYVAASLAVKILLHPTKLTLPLSALVILLNVLFIGGSAIVLGAGRKKLDLRALGFFPPRATRAIILQAIVVSLAILPLRGVVGGLVQILFGGHLDSSQLRMQLIAPEGFSWIGFFVTLLGVGILAPISEELFFRGAIFTWFRGRYNFRVALIVSSVLFGLAHIDTAGVVASSFIFALFAGYLFQRTNTLWASITMHIVSNSFAVCVLYAALALNLVR